MAAACGLFCGACDDMKEGRCHGCGCTCGKCVASSHAEHCKILKCASGKGLDSCADCAELPCTELIMHTCEPLFLTSMPCIENLRRRKTIGTKKWIKEQEAYWADEDNLRKAHFAMARGKAAIQELKKTTGYKRPY